MRPPVRIAGTLLGLALAALLVSRLPPNAFGATQTALLVGAGALLLLAAASLFLAPARRLQAALFLTPARDEAGAFALPRPEEVRDVLLPPVLAALAALGVAGLSALLRG